MEKEGNKKPQEQASEQAPENDIVAANDTPDAPAPATKAKKKRIPTEFYTPIAILIAGLLISASIVYSNAYMAIRDALTAGIMGQDDGGSGQNAAEKAKQISPLQTSDYIRGSQTAPIKLVEYADLDCIFCKRLHDTLVQLTQTYGDKIAWVYRQFPLVSIHPYAGKKAMAAECAAEQGGNDIFWRFVDEAFALQDPSNYDKEVGQIIQKLGLDKSKLDTCVASNKYDNKISAASAEAAKAGANGTPFTVITDGQTFIPIVGALPIEQFQSVIDSLLE